MRTSKMPSLRIRTQSAMTLAEVMVSVTIFVILFGGILMVFAAYADYWQANKAKIELQQEMRWAMTRIASDLRQAISGDIDLDNIGEVLFPVFVKSGSAYAKTENRIGYQLDENQLKRMTENIQDFIVSQKIKQLVGFEVAKMSNNILKITLVGEYQTKGRQDPVEKEIEFFIDMRN